MDVRSSALAAVACLLVLGSCCRAGDVLVFPEDGSHWVNMQVILRKLQAHGHRLTVVRSSRSWYIQEDSALYSTITISPGQAEDVGPDFFQGLIRRSLELQTMPRFWRFVQQQNDITSVLQVFHRGALRMISAILEDAALVGRLREAEFDLLLTDPAFPAGVLLAKFLQLPMVYNVRWLNAGDAHMLIAPSPPSYVPMYNSLLDDRMSFLERTENLLRHLCSVLQEQWVILPVYQQLLQRHFPPGADLLAMQRSADIWLMRMDFVFEFPRPTMPNVVYMGGFQCRAARALPPELEAFMRSSGEHGVVVMSLGAAVGELPAPITEAIASAFARIPQKVVWRYHGQRPASLGNNTLLLQWFPQNDLLGHAQTRLFVSHGGTNGIYEAIYHAVPVLALPLLFDQFDNALRLQVRGAARVLQVATLTSAEFLEGLRDVLESPGYRSSVRRLSELHRDRPATPLDSAVFWIEYVMRHGGAAHLQGRGSDLPWFSYHSLDVLLMLSLMLVILCAALICVCRRWCCWSSVKNTKLD